LVKWAEKQTLLGTTVEPIFKGEKRNLNFATSILSETNIKLLKTFIRLIKNAQMQGARNPEE
jgi:hypothetical protein